MEELGAGREDVGVEWAIRDWREGSRDKEGQETEGFG